MNKYILGLILFCIQSSLSAQNCTITLKGQVLDSSDNESLPKSNIEVIGTNKSNIFTDNKGQFIISNLCKGLNTIHVSHLNCEHLDVTLMIQSDTFITIYLKHNEQVFGNYTVKGNTSKSTQNTIDSRTIDKKKGNSISGLMTELGGVTLLQTGANISKPVVDGLHSNRVLIVNNGIRQEGQNWGMEHAPEIDAFLASDITLIKGAESLKYGSDGIGGVILIQSLSIFKQKTKLLSGEFNSVGQSNGRGGIVSAYIGSRLSEKLPIYWRIQGTLKNSGNYTVPHYYIANTGSREINYSAHIGLNLSVFKTELFYSDFRTKIGLYTGSQVGNLQDLNNAMQSSTPLVDADFERNIKRPFQQVRHQLLKLKNEWHLKKEHSIEAVFSYQNNHREEYDVLRSNASYNGPVFDYYINTYMGDVSWNRYNFHKSKLQFGLFGLRQSNAYTGRFFIPGFYQNGLAQYAIFKRVQTKNELEIGLRNDIKTFETYLWRGNLMHINSRKYFGPSYTIKWYRKINDHHTISLLHSYTWRAPSTNELFSNGLHQALASIEIGDSTFKKEQSFNVSAAHTLVMKQLTIESELFYKYINGFINLVPGNQSILTIRGAFPVFYYQQNNAELYGLNYKIKWLLTKKLLLTNKGNMMFGNDLSHHQYLNMMPPLMGHTSIEYDNKKYSIDINSDYVFKQYRYSDLSDFQAPPKGYILFGTNLNYNFNIKSQLIKTSISIYNLFNTSYRNYLNRMRYFIDEPGRNITFRIIIPLNIHYEK